MMVRVRRCCCDLSTFVTLISSLFATFHICLLVGSSLWYNLFSHQSDNRKKKSLLSTDDPVREVNDDNYESFVRGNKHFSSRDDEIGRWRGEPTFDTIIYVVLLVVAIVGAIVNLLVVLGVKLNRRWLFLPWLVFHLMAIMGCFAGGIYLALHYTLLQSGITKPEDQAMAILSLFPIVGGIFLIFLWVLYDQAFISMGRSNKKDETTESIHTSSTSVNNTRSVASSNYGSNLISSEFPEMTMIGALKSPKSTSSSNGRTEMRKTSDKHIYTKTQSLPRSSKGRRHKIREFSVNLDVNNLLKMKKAKSMEQILDSGGSSNSSIGGTPNVWIADRKSSRSNTQSRPNLSDSTTDLRQQPPRRSSSFDDILNGTLIEIKQQQPLYYTVDRRGRQNLSTFASGARDSSRPTRRPSSAVPRSNRRDSDYQVELYGPVPAPLRRSRRSRSAEFLLETDLKPIEASSRGHVSTTYLSAWDEGDLEIRPKSNLEISRHSIRDSESRHTANRSASSADTIRSVQSVKSVTIAPKVTEFHYSEELDASMSEPDFSNRFYAEEITETGQVPEPIFPTTPVPPPLPHTRHSSWLNKFSPIKPKTGYTRDQIIEYYCSNGDVAL